MEARTEGAAVNLVVADHDMQWMMDVAQDLSRHPQVKVVGFAQTGQAVIERAVSLVADAVLVEYGLPDLTAGEVAVRLAELSPGTAVFAVSASLSAQLVVSAKAKGVVEIFPRDGFVAREAAGRVAAHVDSLRRLWAESARKHGALEPGVGPRGVVPPPAQGQARAVTQTIILVHSPKGGVGKTTVAVNLATAIKLSPILSGLRVALLDFDPIGNLALTCNLAEEAAWNRNVAVFEHVPEGMSPAEVYDLMLPMSCGVMVLPAPPNPAASERVTVELADRILRVLRKYYGVIVVDGGPKISPMVDAALHHATHVLLVATPEGQAVKNASLVVRALMPNPDFPEKPDMNHILRKMFLVVNRVRKSRGELKVNEIAQAVARPVIAELPEDDIVPYALNLGKGKQPVELDPASPFVVAIKRLADDLCGAYPAGIEHPGAAAEARSRVKKPGLFARLRAGLAGWR